MKKIGVILAFVIIMCLSACSQEASKEVPITDVVDEEMTLTVGSWDSELSSTVTLQRDGRSARWSSKWTRKV